MKVSKPNYTELVDNIGSALQKARANAIRAINQELVQANWEIGKHIVEFEQHGKEKAEYGSALLANLARDLKAKYGKGFSKSNKTPRHRSDEPLPELLQRRRKHRR